MGYSQTLHCLHMSFVRSSGVLNLGTIMVDFMQSLPKIFMVMANSPDPDYTSQ